MLARQSVTEEVYDVTVEDDVAKNLETFKDNKQELSDMIDDVYQREVRLGNKATHHVNDVNDTVTYLKMKVVGVKE
jgi:predicted CopG family antitoxin